MLGKNLIAAAVGNVSAAGAADPNFSDTTLLLQADDVNDGSQNNTFLDSSTNTHTITRNGNVTQGSFSPFSQDEGKWGNYFDGTGDYINPANNASLKIGSGDFTFECWFYTPGGRDQTFYTTRGNTTYAGVIFQALSNNTIRVIAHQSGSSWAVFEVSTATLTPNTWQHIAFVRESGTFKAYLDGVEIISTSFNFDVTSETSLSQIGGNILANQYFDGYISNFRAVIGTAVYTSAFTPPTEPLTAISGTGILTCQSNRFVDNSSNALSITVNGDPEVTPFSPFAPSTAYDPATKGGSGYFDGDGDYLAVANDASIQFGTGDFTFECWFYALDLTPSFQALMLKAQDGPWNNGPSLTFNQYLFGPYAMSGISSVPFTAEANRWYHAAVTRSSGTAYFFVDGVLIDSGANTDTYDSYDFHIGAQSNGDFEFNGYVSDARIIKGTALYTSAFTPPTAPLTAVSGTSLLCNFTNAGIYDGTGRNVLETVGDAQVDTAVSKYGTGSMQFDGTGDQITSPHSTLYSFKDENFTVEMWINTTQTSVAGILTHASSGGATNTNWGLYLNIPTSNKVGLYVSDGSTYQVIIDSTTSVNDGNWHHIAATREGSTFRLFVDGDLEETATWSGSISSTSRLLRIGSNNTSFYSGYIDDLRITKGVARYTANFTPPAAKLPNL